MSPKSQEGMYDYFESVRSNPKQEILLGDVMNTGVGVCRHKALLAKVLADEIGLKMRLMEGYVGSGKHAWCEALLNDKIWLFDIDSDILLDVSDSKKCVMPVGKKYLTSPWGDSKYFN